ncbi:MAG: response regulator transcription factor [Solirubrobacterales bacterium]
MTRVLIADDHDAVRQSLTQALELEPDVKVVGEARDGSSAVEMTRELSPDVVFMDVVMPTLGGIEATRQILEQCPGVQVIALSVHASKAFASRMFQAGASGYVLKDGDVEELLHAVDVVSHGQTYLSPEITSGEA